MANVCVYDKSKSSHKYLFNKTHKPRQHGNSISVCDHSSFRVSWSNSNKSKQFTHFHTENKCQNNITDCGFQEKAHEFDHFSLFTNTKISANIKIIFIRNYDISFIVDKAVHTVALYERPVYFI